MAPPFDFLERCFLPLLSRMGARVALSLARHGFYPAGGGEWTATIEPLTHLKRLELRERGPIRTQSASALCASISGSIGVRQVDTLAAALGWERARCLPRMISGTRGPGNALIATIESEHVTEQITGFGERGTSAEQVAARVSTETLRYLAAGVPVGEYLADQLLLPMALGEGGMFRTVEPSLHFKTQLELLARFLGTRTTLVEEAPDVWLVEVSRRASAV